MSRRPHWDDELIETVKNAIFRNCFDHVEGPLYDQDVFPVIAAVEDWQDANGFGRMGSLMRRLIDAEAAVERVRELHYNTATHHPSGCCSECGGTYPCPTVRAFDGGAE